MNEFSLASAKLVSMVAPDPKYPKARLAQNVLASSGIVVVLVDAALQIRFLSPAAISLMTFAKPDVDLTLADIQAAVTDELLLSDVKDVLLHHSERERDVKTPDGRWFVRRALPYRAAGNVCDGVIITLSDITAREKTARELRVAKQRAEQSSIASLRRLSAACHDLRQPMHTLGLIGGLLAHAIKDGPWERLVAQMEHTLHAMSGMLTSLHYGCKLSTGSIRPDTTTFSVDEVFQRLRHEFLYHAEAAGLELRIVPCSLSIGSDLVLFEQMIRSLLEHLAKSSRRARILVGCRRRQHVLRIEFWVTGVLATESGSSAEAGDRVVVPAFGPHIAKRLADLLGCRMRGCANPGKEPAYTIDVPTPPPLNGVRAGGADALSGNPAVRSLALISDIHSVPATGDAEKSVIYIVDDDEEICAALQDMLQAENRVVMTYTTAEAFLDSYRPGNHSCLLVDAYLTGIQGLQLLQRLNEMGCRPPTIMMSGRGDVNVAVQAMKAGALDFIEKPINSRELQSRVERTLARSKESHRTRVERQEIISRVSRLTSRQKQVMQLMLDGRSSKMMAADLFMSQRTVESHRANIMKKMAAKSLPELARMISLAGGTGNQPADMTQSQDSASPPQ